MLFHSRPVHSLILSSHHFLCLPLHLPPCTVPCRIFLAIPDDHVKCPCSFSCVISLKSRDFSAVRWRFQFWFSLPHWLCDLCTIYLGVCGNISSPMPVSFFQCLLLWSTFHIQTKNMDMTRERISLILELTLMFFFVCVFLFFVFCFLSFQMTFSLVTAAVVWAIRCYSSQIFKATDSIQFFVDY